MEEAAESKPRLFFEVEKVIGVSSEGSYQVQWAPAWVSKFQLVGCEHLIDEFHEQQQLEKESEALHLLKMENAITVISNPPVPQPSTKPLQNNAIGTVDDCLIQEPLTLEETNTGTGSFLQVITAESSTSTEYEGNMSDAVNSIDIAGSSDDDDDFFADSDSDTVNINAVNENVTPPGEESQMNGSSPLVFHMVSEESENINGLNISGKGVNKRTKVQLKKKGKRTNEPSDVKPHICPVCSKKFAHKSGLSMHFRSHSGYKPHICQHCNASFARNSNLTRHILNNHSKMRPFICIYCGKEFSRKDDMERHIRAHTGDRPYACYVCDKTFTVRSTLTQHLRLHTGEKPYVCEICDKAFAANYQYHKHAKHCSRSTMFVG